MRAQWQHPAAFVPRAGSPTGGKLDSSPALSCANFSGSEDGVWSALRTWAWMMLAPASTAACALSICSAMLIGTAGLSSLRGTDPVIAQHRMQGLPATLWFGLVILSVPSF